MCNLLLPQKEFFIYVPLSSDKGSLNGEQDSRRENVHKRSAHEDWVKIPLAERMVIYAYLYEEEEKEPLFS